MRFPLFTSVGWLSVGFLASAAGSSQLVSPPGKPAPVPQSPDEQDSSADAEARPFRIPDHGAAKSRMDRADDHAAAGRFGDAISEWQAVLEDHRGDLLAPERPLAGGRDPSAQPVFPGAARRARERLLRLPTEARVLYRQRYEHEADAALDRARERGDRGTLAEVARRWPLTDASQRAWWTIGDLEMERGETDKADAAWSRALASLLEDPDLELSTAADWAKIAERLADRRSAAAQGTAEDGPRAGARRRVTVARAGLEALEKGTSPSAAIAFADALHPNPTMPAPRAPTPDLESWPEPRGLPQHPYKSPDALFPVRAGDALLVSTSLRLIALHAWSGAVLWDSGEPEGWGSIFGPAERAFYFEGVDPSAIVAPAAGGRVALAALQIPLTFVGRFIYSTNVPVTTIIPDRRLFAFDLETGKPLWSHEPPPQWDGESGGFAQRMSVAGPPIVCGSRVLAPFYRLQGRIDYHVGCFDLETGALLWSTALISGQRELNMFGRAEHEFSAPPLVVAGDRVLALTQLGAIASLDLFTGELLWETLYDQIPLPKNFMGVFRAPTRRGVWLNAPPVVSEGVVVATPFDSSTMIGVDLASGGLLWTLNHQTIQELSGGAAIDLLVGVRGNEVILSGNGVAALAAPRGLQRSAPEMPRWSFSDEEFQYPVLGRPVLAGRRIVLPLRSHRIEIDAETGDEVATTAWSPEKTGGNLVVGPGEISSVSLSSATGWFDWTLLTERAHAEVLAHPGDSARALALGRLLADRAAVEWQRGQSDAARAHLAEAEAALEGSLSGLRDGERSPAAGEMHRVLRTEARLKAGLADRIGALAALRRARALAPDAAALRDTLLEEFALLRGSTGRDVRRDAAYVDALAVMDRSCSDLPILCDATPGEDGESAREATGMPRLVPVVGTVARRDSTPWEVPAGLWVLFERAEGAASAGDGSAELVCLHAMLERYADVELSQGSIAAIAADRIGRLLREGRAEGYAAFEARAQKLLDEASSARDASKLARVGRLYPHSKASETADDRRLTWAMESGDVGAVAAIVQAILPRSSASSSGASPGSSWRLAEATERETRALLRLSSALARAGNRESSAELLRTLATAKGDVRSDLDGDGGRTLAELSAGITRWRRPDATPGHGHFRELRKETSSLKGEWEILGQIPNEEGSRSEDPETGSGLQQYAVVRAADRNLTGSGFALVNAIVGRSERTPDLEFAFEDVRLPLANSNPSLGPVIPPWSRRTALAPGRILVVTGSGVSAIDAQGRMAWAWRPEGTTPASITIGCAAGVAVVSVDLGSGRRYLQALDAHSGIELWRVPISDPGLSFQPVLSSNRIALLPSRGRRKCVAFDLFTGRDAISFQIESPASLAAADEAWIDGDLLVIPWFLQAREPTQNQVLAYDLTSGVRAWRVAFGEDRHATDVRPDPDREAASDPRELVAVYQHADRTWLLVRPPLSSGSSGSAGSSGDKGSAPAMLELSTRIGAASPLPNVRIAPSDRILGLSGAGRTQLASSVIYVLGNREGSNEARLRAVDLAGGELWNQVLKPNFAEMLPQLPPPFSPIPHPALSDDTVALVYSIYRTGGSPSTFLECLDQGSGKDLGGLPISLAMGRCDAIKLHPLGSGLLLRGQFGIEVVR